MSDSLVFYIQRIVKQQNRSKTMPLASTITVNVGSPAADVIYTDAVRSGSSIVYYGPSAQNDLQGRKTLRVSHETRKAGVVASLVQFKLPIYDSGSSKYTGEAVVNLTLIRPGNLPVQSGKDLLESIAEFITNSSMANGIIVANAGI